MCYGSAETCPEGYWIYTGHVVPGGSLGLGVGYDRSYLGALGVQTVASFAGCATHGTVAIMVSQGAAQPDTWSTWAVDLALDLTAKV
jgi:hypothetical protein